MWLLGMREAGIMTDNDFDHEPGDKVLVRVRETRKNGPLRAKFVAEVKKFTGLDGFGTKVVWLNVPFGDKMNVLKMKPYEAEFESIDSYDEVNF